MFNGLRSQNVRGIHNFFFVLLHIENFSIFHYTKIVSDFGKEVFMDKRTKSFMICVCVIVFICFMIFTVYAGTRVGAEIGEFIYNIKH